MEAESGGNEDESAASELLSMPSSTTLSPRTNAQGRLASLARLGIAKYVESPRVSLATSKRKRSDLRASDADVRRQAVELDDECERFGKFIASELRKRPAWELDLVKRQILADIFGQLPPPRSSVAAHQQQHYNDVSAAPSDYVAYYEDVGAEYTAGNTG